MCGWWAEKSPNSAILYNDGLDSTDGLVFVRWFMKLTRTVQAAHLSWMPCIVGQPAVALLEDIVSVVYIKRSWRGIHSVIHNNKYSMIFTTENKKNLLRAFYSLMQEFMNWATTACKPVQNRRVTPPILVSLFGFEPQMSASSFFFLFFLVQTLPPCLLKPWTSLEETQWENT